MVGSPMIHPHDPRHRDLPSCPQCGDPAYGSDPRAHTCLHCALCDEPTRRSQLAEYHELDGLWDMACDRCAEAQELTPC